ncbi:MAG TPA: acyloxyacyl hydrolase [Pyrinomonadaceae bacterium]|nr:acyloxyacyl hydrolase [Pyrinomonadaceae bacterium]
MGAKSSRRSGVCARCGALRCALAAVCLALALPLGVCAQTGLTNSDAEGKGTEGTLPQGGVYGFERAATELGFWGGGSLSGTAATGTTEQTRLGLFAFRYARVFSRGENLAFKYTLDVPFAQLSCPPTQQAPGAQPNGPAQLAERRNITGAGLSPVGFQVNFRRRERVQPFVQASGGFLYFGERVPDSGGAQLNFTTDFGGGVQWKAGSRRAWTVGYRFHHVSGGYRVGVNPGFDSNLFYAGFSIFR